jgi:hypothetical protein
MILFFFTLTQGKAKPNNGGDNLVGMRGSKPILYT